MERKMNLDNKKEQNKYEQTRKRATDYYNCKNISDKEIIEFLAEEIDEYRDRIENLDRIIKNSERLNRNIETERNTYHCGIDGGTGKDFTVVRYYEDGVLVKEEIKPCQDTEEEEKDESTCPPIEIGMTRAY